MRPARERATAHKALRQLRVQLGIPATWSPHCAEFLATALEFTEPRPPVWRRVLSWRWTALLVLLLTACGGPITGTVIRKDHDRAWISCGGKPVVCVTHPEEWRLKVRDGSDPDRTKWVTVPAAEWSSTAIGDQYSDGAS